MLDLLDNPNTPHALDYRGYAIRTLRRTDEGIWLLSQIGRA